MGGCDGIVGSSRGRLQLPNPSTHSPVSPVPTGASPVPVPVGCERSTFRELFWPTRAAEWRQDAGQVRDASDGRVRVRGGGVVWADVVFLFLFIYLSSLLFHFSHSFFYFCFSVFSFSLFFTFPIVFFFFLFSYLLFLYFPPYPFFHLE